MQLLMELFGFQSSNEATFLAANFPFHLLFKLLSKLYEIHFIFQSQKARIFLSIFKKIFFWRPKTSFPPDQLVSCTRCPFSSQRLGHLGWWAEIFFTFRWESLGTFHCEFTISQDRMGKNLPRAELGAAGRCTLKCKNILLSFSEF